MVAFTFRNTPVISPDLDAFCHKSASAFLHVRMSGFVAFRSPLHVYLAAVLPFSAMLEMTELVLVAFRITPACLLVQTLELLPVANA
jgi:hypothetical protein